MKLSTLLMIAVLLTVMLLLIAMTHPAQAVSDFVQHFGTSFTVNGQPFNVAGTNNHYIAWSSNVETDNVLNDAAAMHFNVVRTFISVVRGSLDGSVPTIWNWNTWGDPANMGMEGTYDGYWDASANRMAFNDGASGLQKIDYLLVKAHSLNLRVLLAFNDFWPFTGGIQQMNAWYGSSDPYTFFYSDARAKQAYKEWVSHILNHVNSLTGIAYKDDPTIFGWDLLNEPEMSSVSLAENWMSEMSAYVKSIDRNHLLATGSEGFYGGQGGSDPDAQLALPYIDFGTWHTYPVYHGITPAQVVSRISQHCASAQAAQKPVLLEEFGYSSQNPAQASVYASWTNAIFTNPNCAGWLAWRLTSREESGNYPADNGEGFDFHNDTSTTSMTLEQAALQMQQRNVTPTVTASLTPTLTSTATRPPTSTLPPPTLSATPVVQGTFVKGIDFNGPGVTIEGNRWLDYKTALAQGLSVSNGLLDSKNLKPVPAVDANTSTMLNSLVYAATDPGSINIAQTLANGNYQVYLWTMENYKSNSRSFNLKLEGAQMVGGLGRLALNSWAKYGPYSATVSDGKLNIDLIGVAGRPLVMGLAIYATSTTAKVQAQVQAATTAAPNSIATATNTATNTSQPQAAPAMVSGPLQEIDAASSPVQQQGHWTLQRAVQSGKGHYLYSSGAPNDTLTVSFQGASVGVIYVKHPALGSFSLTIDGVVVQQVDSKASSSVFGTKAQVQNLSSGIHTLRIQPVAGTVAIEGFLVEALANQPLPRTVTLPGVTGKKAPQQPTLQLTSPSNPLTATTAATRIAGTAVRLGQSTLVTGPSTLTNTAFASATLASGTMNTLSIAGKTPTILLQAGVSSAGTALTPRSTATVAPTAKPTRTPSATIIPGQTTSNTASATLTPSSTATQTPTVTNTATPTFTPSLTATRTPTLTPIPPSSPTVTGVNAVPTSTS